MKKFLIAAIVVVFLLLLPKLLTEVQGTIDAPLALQKISSGALLVDVRSEGEYQQGHFEGALHIPFYDVNSRIAEFGSDKDKEIVLYCAVGSRAALAQITLEQQGFQKVFNAVSYERLHEEMKKNGAVVTDH